MTGRAHDEGRRAAAGDRGGTPPCPACGASSAGAKFCPECGADLRAVSPSEPNANASEVPDDVAGDTRRPAGDGASSPARGLPRAVTLGGALLALLAVVAIAIVGVTRAPASRSAVEEPTASASPAIADTSGSYAQLVQRANGLYDRGYHEFADGQLEAAAGTFAAAAEVYAAAWHAEPGDPAVGTDWATSLFYSGDIDGALEVVDGILRAAPDFQPAHFNRGNFLAHKARIAAAEGAATRAKELRAEAKAAYQNAVRIDPDSEVGGLAAEAAAAL